MREYGYKGEQLDHNNHNVFLMYYHLVLVTKYRRKMLTPIIHKELEKIISQVCLENKSILREYGGEEDHIHLLIKSNPNTDLAGMVKTIKGRSSFEIRRKFPETKGKSPKHFWSRSYCILTTGGAPIEIIRQYIERQGKKKKSEA